MRRSLLAMGFTGEEALRFKLLFIEAFNAMEAELRSAPPVDILADPRALRKALLDYTEQVVALEDRVAYLEPRAAALDRLAGRHGAENLSNTAKVLNMRPSDLCKWLGANRWTFKRHEHAPWRAFQDKIDAGYLVHVETPDKQRADRSFTQCMVTPKGRAKLAEIFSQGSLPGTLH